MARLAVATRGSREVFMEREYRALAGNGFSVIISATLMAFLYSNPWAPWWALACAEAQ